MIRRGFAPVVDARTRLLILGSLPGEASLAAGQYYANPRNAFWHLIGGVIARDIATLTYDARLKALTDAHIGLWDVIALAQRDGSLDSAIRSPEAADLLGLVTGLPDLRAVAFNGGKAAKLGLRILAPQATRLKLIVLPSSSPAHARPLSEKMQSWAILRSHLPDHPPEIP